MSTEENNNQSTENQQENIEQKVSPDNDKTENLKNLASGFVSNAMKLKEEKPKVFYGIVGGAVLLLGVMLFGGGSDNTVSGPVIKDLVIGQRYVLKGPNAYDKDATIRLVSVPGTIAAYDDTEEDDRIGGCKHMPAGTPVTVLGFQDAYGKKNAFVNVKLEGEGACKGQSAWTLAINVQ